MDTTLHTRMFVYGLLLTFWLDATCLALDLNGNQQSDIWERHHGVTGLVAGADSDGDGISNAGESIAGTHPLQADSVLEVSLQHSGSQPAATWTGVSGKRYLVQSSTNLAAHAWQTVATVAGSGGVQSNQSALTSAREIRQLR